MPSKYQAYKNEWAKKDRKKDPARYYAYTKKFHRKMVEAGLCIKCAKNPATERVGSGNGGKKIKFCLPCKIKYNIAKSEARLVLKQRVLAHYGPGEIAICSWDGCFVEDLDMLSLDHINNGGNIERKTTSFSGGVSFYAKLERQGYPGGFQTLCHNHQWKKEILRRREQLTVDNPIADSISLV